MTRKASACTPRRASASVSPYASTPGSSETSAIQRPSSSRSISILSMVSRPRAGSHEAAAPHRNDQEFSVYQQEDKSGVALQAAPVGRIERTTSRREIALYAILLREGFQSGSRYAGI